VGAVAAVPIPPVQAGEGENATVTFLDPPTNLALVVQGSSRIDLSWDNVTGATGYAIMRNGLVIEANYTGSHTVGSPYQDTGLDPETQYTYRVKGVA